MCGGPSLTSVSLRNWLHLKVPHSTHAFVFRCGAAQKPRLIKKQNRREREKPLPENLVFTASSDVSLHLLLRSEGDKSSSAAVAATVFSSKHRCLNTHFEWEKQTETADGLFSFLASAQTLHCQKTSGKYEIKWGRSSRSRSSRSSHARTLLVVCHWNFFYLAAPTAGLLCNTALVTETYFSHTSSQSHTRWCIPECICIFPSISAKRWLTVKNQMAES